MATSQSTTFRLKSSRPPSFNKHYWPFFLRWQPTQLTIYNETCITQQLYLFISKYIIIISICKVFFIAHLSHELHRIFFRKKSRFPINLQESSERCFGENLQQLSNLVPTFLFATTNRFRTLTIQKIRWENPPCKLTTSLVRCEKLVVAFLRRNKDLIKV